MVANASHVGDDGSHIVLHREPINELTLRRSRAFSDITKAAGGELRGLETTGKEISHHLVREEQHAAVGVVNDEELIRTEQLVGDDQGAERVVAGAPSGIANNVRISLRESGVLSRIQSGASSSPLAREHRVRALSHADADEGPLTCLWGCLRGGYLARFHTALAVDPIVVAGLVYFSSSAVSDVIIRF